MKFKKKEGQITLFIILGIVLLVVIALLFFLGNYIKEDEEPRRIIESKKAPFDVNPIREYVTACLDNVAKEGLLLLGKQGGYIYKSQGGTFVDYGDYAKGVYFIDYGGHRVSYGIYPPKYKVGNFFPNAWEYPWINFPHKDGDLNQENSFEGIFGKNGLPPLSETGGAHSIHAQLESFIKENIDGCLGDFSVFSKTFDIKKGNKDVSVNIAREDLSIHLQYQLRIKNKFSGKETEIKDFDSNPNIRLYLIYTFVDDLINNDITDITFDVKSASGGYISVDVVNDFFNNNDIIIVKDSRSLIKAKPLEFIFARHNRLPALYYIESPLSRTFTVDDTLTQNDVATNPEAADPDEDVITTTSFSFDPDGIGPGLEEASTFSITLQSYGYPMRKCRQDGYYIVKVIVRDDEGLEDYQEIQVPCHE